MGIAREVSEDVSLGAFINVAVDSEPARARELVRGSTAIFARFSAEGAPPDGLSEVTRTGIEAIARSYDEAEHGRASAVHSQSLDDAFTRASPSPAAPRK